SGLSIAVGADYLGRRPGDSASGLTAASTAANIIPNQPTFYLAPRTLVNLALNYKLNKNWSAQVNVQNLLDKQYIAGSLTRFTALAGTPINVLGRVTYSF
ncbi:MAG TPA: hypothetical protein VKC60_07955, partial [Opitutaceae bacterium]|nr:hypothetical protein [Opitutaceae bacterium]